MQTPLCKQLCTMQVCYVSCYAMVRSVPESESPVFTIDRMYYRSCCTVYTVPNYCTEYCVVKGLLLVSKFGVATQQLLASDIASVASRIIMQTLRRRGSFIRRSVGRLHIGPKCPNLFKNLCFIMFIMRLERRTVWNKARVPRTQYASLDSNYTTETVYQS